MYVAAITTVPAHHEYFIFQKDSAGNSNLLTNWLCRYPPVIWSTVCELFKILNCYEHPSATDGPLVYSQCFI